MHDLLALDRRGIPAVAIATEAFQPAAAAQSEALAFGAVLAWVPHPIQNRTADELRSIAEGVADAALAAVGGGAD